MSQANSNTAGRLVPVAVPGTNRQIMATEIDGKPMVSIRHACEAIGIDHANQITRLNRWSWATVVMTTTVGSDGKAREMAMIDRRTFTSWLTHIDPNRVSEDARPIVEAFQAEAADALDAYFNEGGAINPRASEEQLHAVIAEAKLKMELCQAAKGLIHPDHLDAQARIILARGLGEAPQLDPATRPLYVQDFLKEKKVPASRMSSVAGNFGKKVKAAYIAKYGREPEMYPLQVPNGKIKEVKAYTEADRHLMERAWQEHYAPLTLEIGDAA